MKRKPSAKAQVKELKAQIKHIYNSIGDMRDAQLKSLEAVQELAKHNAIMMGIAKLLNDKGVLTNDEFAQILFKAGIEYTVKEQDTAERQPDTESDSGHGGAESGVPTFEGD
jgi:hypothetical protein